MAKMSVFALVGLATFVFSTAASATCPFTFQTFSNGNTANADQVMDNFNYILTCPNFTGSVYMTGGLGLNSNNPYLFAVTSTTPFYGLSDSSGRGIRLGTSDFNGTNTGSLFQLEFGTGTGNTYTYLNASQSGGASPAVLALNPTGGPVGIGSVNAGIFSGPGTQSLFGLSDSGGRVIRFGTHDYNGSSTGSLFQLEFGAGTGNTYTYLGAYNAGGTTNGILVLNPNGGKVGIGTTAPAQALEVNGQVRVDALASASSTSLCITATSNGVLATCSSSIRYKENVKSAGFGLKEVMAMRPVTFKWKGRDEQDFGLIAEEVAKIDSRYVTYKAGKIEGVKYPQLTAVLVNAVKELKAVNDRQAAEMTRLHAQNMEQAADVRDVRSRLRALERRMIVHTAENLSATSP